MANGDNNSHTQFTIAFTDTDDATWGDTPYETYDITDIARDCEPGDHEGYMDVTVVETGDVVRVAVTFHVTDDGLVDVEAV